MPDYDAVLAEAVGLPIVDRLQLIETLWDTVPAGALPPLDDAWLAEIQRRSVEYDSGSVQTVPWEQIRADAMRRAGLPD
jgi:putative addiction module component (TIGR02574 family)